jgi:urease accessory protein
MPMRRTLVVRLALLTPSIALAHVGVGDTSGVAHGFMHPVSGLDHVLAMVAVGMFAAPLGGRALWLVPLAFMTMMALGGTLGIPGVGMPYLELGIGLSVVMLGAALALALAPPLAVAMALAGLFAIFHGMAHGAEMPVTASALAYGLGFITATAMLHAIGIAFGLLAARKRRVSQFAGGAMAVAGLSIVGGLI